jgi:hypothetical protein
MTKVALMLFTASVLMTTLLVVNLPQANALIQRDFSIYDDSHTTASYGSSKVCGIHLCSYGEHAKWSIAMSMAQRGEMGKVNAYGSTPMDDMSMSMYGNSK